MPEGARALGVSHGTVYRHFPSKAALAFHAMRRFHHPMHRRYWTDPGMPEHYDAVWELVAAGLAVHRP